MIHDLIDYSVQLVELTGALLVLGGVAITVYRMARVPFMDEPPPLAPLQIRLGLGMFLALGLEFLLAADILRTAVAPTYKDVILLASIAAIRTALNFFLGREFIAGQQQLDALRAADLSTQTAGPPALHHAVPAVDCDEAVDPPDASADSQPEAASPDPEQASTPVPWRESMRRALLGPLWRKPNSTE